MKKLLLGLIIFVGLILMSCRAYSVITIELKDGSYFVLKDACFSQNTNNINVYNSEKDLSLDYKFIKNINLELVNGDK